MAVWYDFGMMCLGVFGLSDSPSEFPTALVRSGGNAESPNGVAFAFASGLAVKGNTVLVTYGAGDREARALVMTMEKLDVTWQDGRGKSPRLN